MSVKTEIQNYNVVTLAAVAEVDADAQTGAIAITNYKGVAKLIVMVEAVSGTTPTLDITVQQSATSGGEYADVTGAVFTQVEDADATLTLDLDLDGLSGFIRLDLDVDGTEPVYNVGAVMLARSE
jgi:hypothetical protein